MLARRTSRIPGLWVLWQGLILSLPPVAGTWLFLRILERSFPVYLPGIVVTPVVLSSVPIVYALRLWYKDARAPRDAKHAGAILPPRWDGISIGNRDILAHTLEGFRNGYLGEGFWDRVDELGHLHSIRLLWDTMYATNDAEVIKTILATHFVDFEKGAMFRDTVGSVLGAGVFNTDGELWKFHRTMTRPYFSRDRISHFELFDIHASVAIAKMKEHFRGGHAVDFQDLMARFTLDSATEFLVGTCVDNLKNELPYAHNDTMRPPVTREAGPGEKFVNAFNGAEHVMASCLRLGWTWRIAEFFGDKAEPYMRAADEFLGPILMDAIEKNKTADGDHKDEEHETLLDHLVKYTDDPVILRDETFNMLVAGSETTASTLTFVIYLLCLNPNVFMRLRVEIMEALDPSQMPTFDDVRHLKYLRAVINETLRLYPIAPFNLRVAVRDTTLPNPSNPTGPQVFVPAGTAVLYSVFLMHRRKDYWGPDALDFDPDCWLDGRLNQYFSANPFIFLPFNAGPRICLGQQFAYNEISFFLIRLLQHFSHMEIDLSSQPPESCPPTTWAAKEGQQGKEKIFPKTHVTLYLQGGLWVKMTEANQDA
ncbi:cytochrome P450 monooxygenase pc-3 [Trametes meyenii]|nr:cytochrome P450 monooxygenase pc-3 [Trametes meyenii]